MDATPEQLRSVVTTNLQGSLLCTRAAMRAMAAQPGGGHVFNMDGAGADGMATPQYAAYGATKAGGQPLARQSLRASLCCGCHERVRQALSGIASTQHGAYRATEPGDTFGQSAA